jgi:DNA-binding transcriptional LysR family regulator
LLDSALLDLAITVRPFDRPEIEFVPLFEDELRFIVAPDHPWARRGRASREDLEGKTLLVYLKMNGTPKLLAEYFLAEGLALGQGVELADPDAIMRLVHTSMAVGVLSPWLASKELQSGSLVSVPMGPRPLLRQWGVAYVRKRGLAPMEYRFIELCRLAVPGILSRMQGHPVDLHEKKEEVGAPLADSYLKYGGVALILGSFYNFLSASPAWENLGSILSAVS